MLFFFNDTAPTKIYPLPLHDALPISEPGSGSTAPRPGTRSAARPPVPETSCPGTASASTSSRARTPSSATGSGRRSEEHTSELQSRQYLVCRLLLEKKKNSHISYTTM